MNMLLSIGISIISFLMPWVMPFIDPVLKTLGEL